MTIIPCRILSCCRNEIEALWWLVTCVCSCFQVTDLEEIVDGSSHGNSSHHNSPIHNFFDKVRVLDFLSIFQLLLEELFLLLRVLDFLNIFQLLLEELFLPFLIRVYDQFSSSTSIWEREREIQSDHSLRITTISISVYFCLQHNWSNLTTSTTHR